MSQYANLGKKIRRVDGFEKVTGRGVLLMQAFMDQVAYNEVGNEVTLRKRRPVDGKEDRVEPGRQGRRSGTQA